MPNADKLILSVQSKLKNKYKKQFPELLILLRKWVASDKEKGLNTQLIFLDDKTKMSALRIRAIHPEKSNESDYKQCVDALYRYFQPDYILFFGAIDILPQQKLYNPLYKTDHEDEPVGAKRPALRM